MCLISQLQQSRGLGGAFREFRQLSCSIKGHTDITWHAEFPDAAAQDGQQGGQAPAFNQPEEDDLCELQI